MTKARDLADGVINTSELADGSITTAKLADGAISAAKIADSAISTAKIADGGISTAKIADSAISAAKIADGDITDAKLATGITASKLSGALPAVDGSALTGLSGGTPAGTIGYFAATTAPDGFLKANGATVSRTTYSDLFTAIGTTYGVGDGSTTFDLPDLRGEFLRSLDDGRGIDGGRSIGTAQSDDNKSHQHIQGSAIRQYGGTFDYGVTSSGLSSRIEGTSGAGRYYTHPHTSYVGGSEARPRNVALLACIKY